MSEYIKAAPPHPKPHEMSKAHAVTTGNKRPIKNRLVLGQQAERNLVSGGIREQLQDHQLRCNRETSSYRIKPIDTLNAQVYLYGTFRTTEYQMLVDQAVRPTSQGIS